MKRYWVVGGEYRDTRFKELAAGRTEERFGPHRLYAEARREWQNRTMASIDNVHRRYVITVETEARTPRPKLKPKE